MLPLISHANTEIIIMLERILDFTKISPCTKDILLLNYSGNLRSPGLCVIHANFHDYST